ncbi:TetR/AcrR family transcriptional regulator [Sphingobium sufflavum]|uniref:TetR/AcrR family transcriptional regulator n=1 Tax=Sphingobium sufflavum TaxID=1129547 RepID=UPI001F3B582A|nr:TetR/AcrR family transcriptional regulator [Sphingobium sufflavum]MCE7795826.1 TetR/AcrR family transcriptional regulator [Sphingobium sufflavum]
MASPPARSRLGRPTREEAEQRHADMLETALDMFLEKGFEQTTIEAIATALGMTKRTIYARYEDKAALFKAAVQQAIERWIMPQDQLEALTEKSLEEALLAIARLRVAHVLTPQGLKMQRILTAEAYRFPEIFASAYDQGSKPVIAFLSGLLQRHHDMGAIHVPRPFMAATVFLGMVVGGPTRTIALGAKFDPQDVEDRLTFSVSLFLDGVRSR